MQRSTPPVKGGDIKKVNVEAIAEKGDGIAKIDGYVVFVPDSEIDKNYEIKITKALDRFGFGEIVKEL